MVSRYFRCLHYIRLCKVTEGYVPKFTRKSLWREVDQQKWSNNIRGRVVSHAKESAFHEQLLMYRGEL